MKKMMNGALVDMTTEEIADLEARQALAAAVTSDMVNEERDRRIRAGLPFDVNGDGSDIWVFDFDGESSENITGAGALAGFAAAAGSAAQDYTWMAGVTTFAWTLADNRTVPVDAPTMFRVAEAAALWKAAHTYASLALKALSPIPTDYTDNSYWP